MKQNFYLFQTLYAFPTHRKPDSISNMTNSSSSRKFLVTTTIPLEDAKMYINKVKLAYADNPHIYDTFLSIAKSYKSNQIDTIGVIVHVTQLFQGNKTLLLGLNNFLPKNGYEIMVSEHDRAVSFRTPSRSKFTRIPMVKLEEEEFTRQEDNGFTTPIDPPSHDGPTHQEKYEEHTLNPIHTIPKRPKERVAQKGKHSNMIMTEQHQRSGKGMRMKMQTSQRLRRSPRFRLTKLKGGSEQNPRMLGKRKTKEKNPKTLKRSSRLMELRRRIQTTDAS